MTRLYLYDDAKAREFEPFALTRPVSELRAGALLIRIRWERVAKTKAYGFIGAPHLASFDELDAPPAVAKDTTIAAGSLVVNSRFVASLSAELENGRSVF
ncbi:MAG: putative sugar nucleotidyl transferase, partial [Gemmatimonadales bacterium]